MKLNFKQAIDASAAAIMLLTGLVLTFLVFPTNIPAGLKGDFSSGYYPGAIMTVWIASSTAWLFKAIFLDKADSDLVGIPSWQRSLQIAVVIAVGYALFLWVGFLVAAFFIIVTLSHMCGERGWAPWALGLIVPFFVYFFLLKVLAVRLPSMFF